MSEINKLRQRLTNVGKSTTEYRMTVVEAKALVKEIDAMVVEYNTLKEETTKVVIDEPTVIIQIMDGGSL